MPSTPAELQTADRQRIKKLCGDAYLMYDQGDHKAALRAFYQAWLALPKPQHEYPESAWALTGIGDCYFRLQQYQQAIEALNSALHCPNAEQSAFLHLRLGQSLLHTGANSSARESLLRAHQQAGHSVFENEAPEYLAAIDNLLPA